MIYNKRVLAALMKSVCCTDEATFAALMKRHNLGIDLYSDQTEYFKLIFNFIAFLLAWIQKDCKVVDESTIQQVNSFLATCPCRGYLMNKIS